MSRAIVSSFRRYTPFGKEFYQPLFDYFIHNLSTYKNEYDHLYILDSLWEFTNEDKAKVKEVNGEIVWSDPSLRYYDAYKAFLPTIKESAVLFLDNDMIIYKPQVIDDAFSFLTEGYGVVSIYDTIGEKTFEKLNGQSKFCPYLFCSKKHTLMNFLEYDWGPAMPKYETLGLLTEKMLEWGVKPVEFDEDKSSIYFDGTKDGEKGKNLGYYHIRAGSTPAYLMATREYGNKETYNDYVTNQPKQEILRHCAWYDYMNKKLTEGLWKLTNRGMVFMLMLKDLGVELEQWDEYMRKFERYHGL